MDRIGGIWGKDDIPRTHCGQHKVGQSLLGPNGRYGLSIRIDFHIESSFIPIGDGGPQFGDSGRCGVSVVVAFSCCLNQFGHDMFWRRYIGIPHTKIDNILTLMSQLHFQAIHDLKDVGRQTTHSAEFLHKPTLLPRKNSVKDTSYIKQGQTSNP